MGKQWNSFAMETTYEIFGWIAFFSWSFSFYPQIILNFRRKSVVGFNFNFAVLNVTKHSTYLIYNATLYFSSAVQEQYRQKYGLHQMIPVAANDVAFSTHAVLMSAFTLFQIYIYERGNQKVSKISLAIVTGVWCAAAVCFFIALPTHSWLWLISVFKDKTASLQHIGVNCFFLLLLCATSKGTLQVTVTVIKYFPQAFMNFYRKSTDGFSIGMVLLDFLGGVTNYGQMGVQSIDQGSWTNFYGNLGKTLLSLVSIFYDLIFMMQHYVLYRGKKPTHLSSKIDVASKDSLLNNADQVPEDDLL